MKFILILTIVLNGYGGGPGVTSAEFDSLAKCELAGEKWLSTSVMALIKNSTRVQSSYICVEK